MGDTKLGTTTARDGANPTLQPSSVDTSAKSTSARSRFSIASTETGESSRTGSTLHDHSHDGAQAAQHDDNGEPTRTGNGTVRRTQANRKTRHSGGFLLNDSAFATPTRERTKENGSRTKDPSREHKGKLSYLSGKISRRKKEGSSMVLGSPLATTVTNAAADDHTEQGGEATRGESAGEQELERPTTSLDVDAAQIVNLALNLSESRRIASRRNVSQVLPPPSSGLGDGMTGGSLRQHLQQQRRTSRNISPRADRTAAGPSRLSSGLRNSGTIPPAFQSRPDEEYEYHFSASTLARAEKARKVIELMAQYRRLLQYVPPLKPQPMTRTSTLSPMATAQGSPSMPSMPLSRTISTTKGATSIGRPYNPLQYIRNRKVRLRERRVLDGEAEGFGDVEKVKLWVDKIASEPPSEGYLMNDCVLLPPFFGAEDTEFQSHNSPPSATGRLANTPIKSRRPRMDWVFTPEDLIADLVWLEKDDNKKLIEDSDGRKIFPANTDLKRPMSRESAEPMPRLSVDVDPLDSDNGYRSESRLPRFKSMKHKFDDPDSARGRARQKLHDKLRLQHGHNSSHNRLFRSDSRSSSSSSSSDDSDRDHKDDEHRDPAYGILERQMMELLEKEANGNGDFKSKDAEGQNILDSVESEKQALHDGMEEGNGGPTVFSKEKKRKIRKKDIASHPSSGRTSLDVDYGRTRSSIDSHKAPKSPSIKLWKAEEVPEIDELISPLERETSPSRNPFDKARSKINSFRDRSHDRGRASLEVEDASWGSRSSSEQRRPAHLGSPERRKRSISPTKRLLFNKKANESSHSFRPTGNSRRKTDEDQSSGGLRGLFKAGRLDDIVKGPVSKVSDFIWKKDGSPGSGISYETSSDESETEREPVARTKSTPIGKSGRKAVQPPEVQEQQPKSFADSLPTFTSPFESRGRSTTLRADDADQLSENDRQRIFNRPERFERLKPPRIDIQSASPTLTPSHTPSERRDSSVSNTDVEAAGVRDADARLNAILGLPGHLAGVRPMMTGLANISADSPTQARFPAHLHRHPSSSSTSMPYSRAREWSVADCPPPQLRGAVNRREIARVHALLLSSGVKAAEIVRRANTLRDLHDDSDLGPGSAGPLYASIVPFAKDQEASKRVAKSQLHILAGRVLGNEIQTQSLRWQESASTFTSARIPALVSRLDQLKDRVRGGCMERVRVAGDEADAVGAEIVGEWTMCVKRVADVMEAMRRRRRRRFRWLRRTGWVLLEWVLVGVMWWVWGVVVLLRGVQGLVGGVGRAIGWLFWL
jgi:hypothetical protein